VTRADLPLRLKRASIVSGIVSGIVFWEVRGLSPFRRGPRRNFTCLYYPRAEWGGVKAVVKSLEMQDPFDGLEARLAALYFNEPSIGRVFERDIGV